MDIKQKCGYILYFGKARKKLETRYRKARPARGPIHKSPSSPEARKIQARNITTIHYKDKNVHEGLVIHESNNVHEKKIL